MRPLRIVTTGLAATFPMGGVFWDYLQYTLGFLRLGHRVLYLEDSTMWSYDPDAQTFVEDGTANAAALGRNIERLDPKLARAWSYRDARGTTYGLPFEEVARFCAQADLFLNISGSCYMRDEYLAAGRTAFIDSDPMYTQSWIGPYLRRELPPHLLWRAEHFRRHDLYFTFAEEIGRPGCTVPTELFDWQPTRQPIVLEEWGRAVVPLARRRPALTTVLSWEPREGSVWVEGTEYYGKGHELLRFLELPARSALPLELAISGVVPEERLLASGFRLRPAIEVSRDPSIYRDYLARSAGEWSVAKNAYVASRSGWSSCRTACYLALGVPAVVQETGFSRVIPSGEGLLAFSSLDEASSAIARLAAEPERHAAAALRVAERHFDARLVLGDLLRRALGSEVEVAPRSEA